MGKHKSVEQDCLFLTFMQENPKMAKGYAKEDRKEIESLWDELTDGLNNYGPPFKDKTAWKKIWIDKKVSIKKKLAHIKNRAKTNSSSRFEKFFLSPLEEEVAKLCDLYSVVEGTSNTNTSDFTNRADSPSSCVSSCDDYKSNMELLEPLSKKPRLRERTTRTRAFKISKPDYSTKSEKSSNSLLENKNCVLENIESQLETMNATLSRFCDLFEAHTKEMRRHNLAQEKGKK